MVYQVIEEVVDQGDFAGEKKTTFFSANEDRQQVNHFQLGKSGVTNGKHGKQRLCKECNGRYETKNGHSTAMGCGKAIQTVFSLPW